MATLNFPDISLCGPSVFSGQLDVSSEKFFWKSKSTKTTVNIVSKTLKEANWVDVGKTCQLWLTDANDVLTRLDGFRGSDFERVSAQISSVSPVKLTHKSVSLNGRNFGDIQVVGAQMEFVDNEKNLIAPIPLSSVSLVAIPVKNEVEIQFENSSDVERDDEVLTEMRFVVPETHLTTPRKRTRDAPVDEVDDSYENGVDGLQKLLSSAAGIQDKKSDALVTVAAEHCSFQVPRGRFSMEFYADYLVLSGASYEFKVNYKTISRINYLPLPVAQGTYENATRYAIVISLTEPLRHGTQRHPHLVLYLDNKNYIADLHIPEEDVKEAKYGGLGAESSSFQGPLPKVIGSLLRKISNKPVFKPESFLSKSQQRAVKCTMKTQSGFLYPLDKSLIWIPKPTVWIRYTDIESIHASPTNSLWEMIITLKSGSSDSKASVTVLFNIDHAEFIPLSECFKKAGVNFIDNGVSGRGSRARVKIMDIPSEEEEEEEEDEDFEGGEESSDDDDDDDDDDSESEEENKRKSKKGSSKKGKKDESSDDSGSDSSESDSD